MRYVLCLVLLIISIGGSYEYIKLEMYTSRSTLELAVSGSMSGMEPYSSIMLPGSTELLNTSRINIDKNLKEEDLLNIKNAAEYVPSPYNLSRFAFSLMYMGRLTDAQNVVSKYCAIYDITLCHQFRYRWSVAQKKHPDFSFDKINWP